MSVNTSVTNSCQTLRTFDVLAGTGPFNGSLVKPFLSTYNTTVPYFAIASSYSFISNPQFSVSLQPPSCAGGMVPCESHVLPGGTYLMWPQINDSVPVGLVVHIDNAPAMRLDFAQGLNTSDDYFSPASCAIYGDGIVALMFCLEKSATHHDALKAGTQLITLFLCPTADLWEIASLTLTLGVYVCENGVQNGECRAGNSGSTHNVTTTFSVAAYTASSITGAENNTILSVSSIAATELKSSVDVEALSLAVGWLLNYTAAHLPEQSSVVFGFWETGPASYHAIWQASAYNLLKSTLAFLLWEFTPNNNGNPAVANAESNNQTPDLPAEFHAKASVCQPFIRFVINEASFIVYSVLHSVALLFCWSVVLMGYWHRARLPVTTSLPLVDFAAKLRCMPGADMGVFHNVGRADTFDDMKASLQNVNVGSGKSVAGSIQKQSETCVEREDAQLPLTN